MMTKKFVPCIYLYRGKAVRSFKDTSIIEEDPVKLARYYNENNADEIFVFDMSAKAVSDLAHAADTEDEFAFAEDPFGDISAKDALHEEALDIIKAICAAVDVDVSGVGNIRRMEDVKKLLYAGCKRAVLNYDNASNIDITEEVSLKFGRDRLMIAFHDSAVLKTYKERIKKYVSSLLLMNPHLVEETEEVTSLPFYVQINQIQLNKLMNIFSHENVCGIIGNTINDNVKEILAMKDICQDNGIPVVTLKAAYVWEDFRKNSDGMVPVVVQDYKTLEVLQVAYMNEEAYYTTIRTGKMTYFSRSRQELWTKGVTSGHFQYVKSLTADCDKDTILAKVFQVGAACHTGARSCFFNEIAQKEASSQPSNPIKVFEDVFRIILDRKEHPKEGSYTNYLFDKGLDKILKKLGEEAAEIIIAAKNPNANEIKYEISDFLYHMMVLMAEKDVTWEEITTELANR